MLRIFFCLLYLIFVIISVFSEIPIISQSDYIFEKADTGYELYIKKYDRINSILLTESQKDPSLKKTNYGLRTEKFHPCNGNETRILDDKILQTKYDVFFLVDSTPEKHKELGWAFRFFLPEELLYGYQWEREGVIKIQPGVRINLRLFEKHFADYSGEFRDQWITLNLKHSKEIYRPRLFEDYSELTEKVNGKLYVRDKDQNFKKMLIDIVPENVPPSEIAELIFIIDTTLSMEDEMSFLKWAIEDIKREIKKKVETLRIGLILYKDYGDIYLNRVYDLTDDEKIYTDQIKKIYASGGDDIPEAVNEAIYQLDKLNYISDNRIAFLIGDAPAHSTPRGKISRDDAVKVLLDKKIKLVTMCLPYK